MPRFEPFVGLRYSPSHIRALADVVCPPYDVISPDERAALLARSPSNVVRLELPIEDGSGDPYSEAAILLDSWRDGGILRRDRQPAFYGYRMTYRDANDAGRSTIGVIGALGLEAPGQGILPHEHTTPKAKSDRLDLLRATRTNLSPIWGLSPARGLSARCQAPAHPADHAVDDDGVLHELWPIVDDELIRAISDLVGSAPVVIADGHHRFETALNYREERRHQGLAVAGDDSILALVVELASEQLSVQAIHRLISGLPQGSDVVSALAAHFELVATTPVDATMATRMSDAGAMAIVTNAGTWLAQPRPPNRTAATHDLDSSRLDAALASLPDHLVTYQHGSSQAVAAVDAGRAQAAILLRPVTVDQIAAVATGGVRMPPKTTLFWPKPRTGLVMRELLA